MLGNFGPKWQLGLGVLEAARSVREMTRRGSDVMAVVWGFHYKLGKS